MPRNFSSHLQYIVQISHLLKKINAAQEPSLGFRHSDMQKKNHKTMEGLIFKEKMKKADYTLLP